MQVKGKPGETGYLRPRFLSKKPKNELHRHQEKYKAGEFTEIEKSKVGE
jgi:hypothetical protein